MVCAHDDKLDSFIGLQYIASYVKIFAVLSDYCYC